MTATEVLALPRWLLRYKLYFGVGIVILLIQVFLAYKSLGLYDPNLSTYKAEDQLGSSNDVVSAEIKSQQKRQLPIGQTTDGNKQQWAKWGIHPACNISSKEALSALNRAKTTMCREQIANIACDIQQQNFYPKQLQALCPATNYTAKKALGCFKDEKDFRMLAGYYVNLKAGNTPNECIHVCLQSGFPFAGVQYGRECFCGADMPPNAAKLPDSSCNMKCTGDSQEVCGGFYSMNVFETGIAKFAARIAETNLSANTKRVRIAFLLTLNGRALRQVHRLIKALYSPEHVFYIHVDSRQHYLYRKLLELEIKFPNIRLARRRFSTIWGGASLLTMLLQSMQDLLASSWEWDFVINLSESDFPVKTVDRLVDFLSANKESNFVKSHGRETQRFIQKQGLDKTFVECDTHMWRIGDRTLPQGIQIDGGSDWVALSRRFVQFVIAAVGNEQHESQHSAEVKLIKGLLIIFRQTLLPAESFFHTVLRNTQFCNSYVDNNLHVTNWKRKLGCKCQYKHVVDWCGCSPNDFKPDDWNRLHITEHKQLYFARKFEPIINQAVILKLEEWLFGPYTSEYANLNSYWQSFYDADDAWSKEDDLILSMGNSLMRLVAKQLQVKPKRIKQIHHYFHMDECKGFLLRFEAQLLDEQHNSSDLIQLESRIRPLQYAKVAKNSKFARRLRNFEVSSDFDQKEQISRNFAKMLGPSSELVLSFNLAGAHNSHVSAAAASSSQIAHSYNLTVLWLDPQGRLQDFNELHIEDSPTDAINFSKSLLQQPLTPGIWTLKLIARQGIYAQTKFLVSPLVLQHGKPLQSSEQAKKLNGGSLETVDEIIYPVEWQQFLPPKNQQEALLQKGNENSLLLGQALDLWIDDLISKFYHIRETCIISSQQVKPLVSSASGSEIPQCEETSWSSLSYDPKSDIHTLLSKTS